MEALLAMNKHYYYMYYLGTTGLIQHILKGHQSL